MLDVELLKIKANTKKETIAKLIESSSPTHNYFLILILSALITTLGILMNNASVVIGGMLVSPLLSPILAISLGISMADFKLIVRSLRVLVTAVLFVLLISIIISVFDDDKVVNVEIMTRMFFNISYFVVAVAAGVAAAFAMCKEEFSERLVGIAVAIALLPPLSVMGIGIAYWNFKIFAGSVELFFANLAGVLLGSLVVFSLLGFYPEKKIVQKELKAEEKALGELKNNHNHNKK